jgi:hypothetical protein
LLSLLGWASCCKGGESKLRAELSRPMSSGKDGDVWVVYI